MRLAVAVVRVFLPYVLPTVAIVVLGYLATMPRPPAVIIEWPSASPAVAPELIAAPPRPPVLQITETEIIYQGRLIATVESVRNDSPIFRIEALSEALAVTADEVIESIPGDRLRRERDEICANKRDEQPSLHLLCPGRTLVVETDESTFFHGQLMAIIANSASIAGYHAAFTRAPVFQHYRGLAR